MSLRLLLRPPRLATATFKRPVLTSRASPATRPPRRTRTYSSQPQQQPQPPPPNPSSSTSKSTTTTTRLSRVIDRLPRPLRPYASRLHSAPLSHAAAFLILHEITAVVPLLGLFGIFHYTDLHVAPVAWVSERYGGYVQEGLGRFERYFRRKGWFGFSSSPSDDRAEEATTAQGQGQVQGRGADTTDAAALQAAEGPYRVVVEVALAYAITKALLPLRIAASLWATPWFARVLVRARGLFRLGR